MRVREIEGGEIVNFHCRVEPTVSVADVHEKVDDLERALRLRFRRSSRAIGHASRGPRPSKLLPRFSAYRA